MGIAEPLVPRELVGVLERRPFGVGTRHVFDRLVLLLLVERTVLLEHLARLEVDHIVAHALLGVVGVFQQPFGGGSGHPCIFPVAGHPRQLENAGRAVRRGGEDDLIVPHHIAVRGSHHALEHRMVLDLQADPPVARPLRGVEVLLVSRHLVALQQPQDHLPRMPRLLVGKPPAEGQVVVAARLALLVQQHVGRIDRTFVQCLEHLLLRRLLSECRTAQQQAETTHDRSFHIIQFQVTVSGISVCGPGFPGRRSAARTSTR